MTTILAMTDAEGTITSKSENMPWEGLALRVLGTLSSKVRGPGNQERALWQALSSSLHFLEQQLARLSVGLSMAGILKFHSSISCFKFLLLRVSAWKGLHVYFKEDYAYYRYK